MKQFSSILFCLVLVLGIQVKKSWAVDNASLSTEEQIQLCVDKKSGTADECLCRYIPNDAKCINIKSKSDLKEESSTNKQACIDAMKEYNKAIKANPCGSSGATKACYEQIASCQASTGVTSSQSLVTGDENIDGIANTAMEMIKASQASKQNSATDFQPDRSCYSALRVGDKEAAKERKSRRDQIIKDIEAADKERREANEKLAKETNETKVEQQKLQAETTKTIQKLDVEKREKLTKMNEDLQKAGTDIRKQTTEIIKIKQAMEKLKFENQKTLTAYTEEKINQQCKSALDTAKVCFVQASKGKKFSKDDTCSNFTFSGSGTKGTAELKKKLKQVKDACFEQSNQTVSTIKYDYADKVRTYEMDIKEKQEQIADANKALEAKKAENEAINKETEAQKTQEQKSLEEQMANFAEKLANLQKSTDAAIKSSEDKIALLNAELKDLKAGALASETADPGSQSIYDNIANEANGLLNDIASSTATAFGACCQINDPSKKVSKSNPVTAKPGIAANNCGTLYQQTSEENKRAAEKAKNNSNK